MPRYSSCRFGTQLLLSAVVLTSTELAAAAAEPQPRAKAESSASLRAIFADPPREYSTGPLWTWNDLLTEEQVVSTLRDLASQKVRQVWVHPQPGLMTPYLSDDPEKVTGTFCAKHPKGLSGKRCLSPFPAWFRLWKAALDEAKKLDVNIWMYDENSYPSGFAGGHVPEAMPESRGRGLHFREEKRPGKIGPDMLGVFQLTNDMATNVTQEARSGKTMPDGKYLNVVVVRAANSPWHGGRCYVDLLYPGVTQKFLEITLEPYRRRFGDEFGKHIPGVFTDEPSIRPAGGLPWTDDLPQQFQKRWGYSLVDHLPSLARPVGDWRRVRHNYFQVLLDLFIDRWGKPYFEYCQKHGIELTGHYLEHEWPSLVTTPDFMAMQAWEHRPGIDLLMNQYQELPRAQFGNVRIVKEIGSVANQLGRRRTLSETYAGSGHEIRFEEMKRQGDWLYVLGLNTLNECLSHVTIRGVRKGNWPRTLSYHNPWWGAYHVLEGYFTRLSAAMSHGKQVNPVLVIEPTATAWMYQKDKHVEEIGDQFQKLLVSLERAQVEYDLGSEDIIARNGSADGPSLVVGQRRYRIIVLPPLTENLNATTVDLLAACLKSGATVISCGPPPKRIDGQPSPRVEEISKLAGWRQLDAAALPVELLSRAGDGFAVRRDPDDRGILFHHRRQFDDGQMLFLVNTSIESPSRGTIQSSARGVQQWCLESGKIQPYRFTTAAGRVEARFELPPCGSLLLFLSNQPGTSASAPPQQAVRIEALGSPTIRRLEDNVLVLNYLDLATRGQTKQSIHCRQATVDLFKRNGFFGNPWFESVQFADEHIRKRFPPESGFEATYHFGIAERVPERLHFVLERPDLYQTIACNGVAVKSISGAWWLDRSFGRIDLRASARVGENTVTIKASPFTVFHELEPAYVLGAFSLRSAENGFVIVPETPLKLDSGVAGHSTQPNGAMWLSGGIGFRPDLPPKRNDDPAPFIIFDLGRPADVKALRIWNYNEPQWATLGVKQMAVTAGDAASAGRCPISLGTIELKPAPESPLPPPGVAFPQSFPADAKGVRFLRFDVLSNHNGVAYPTHDKSRYHAFVGLSEVRFLGADGQPIPGVGVHRVSGELDVPGLCSRRAINLVDSSGLLPLGWDGQGHPFYSGGVGYSEEFDIPQPAGRYCVELPAWHGSVAKVIVNGKLAVYIGWRPWECDVTELVRPGRNTIEVIVFGTLRNTLGPHHAGPPHGIVTPHMFNQAPVSGPPPGLQYTTIGYGLFGPFVLKNVK